MNRFPDTHAKMRHPQSALLLPLLTALLLAACSAPPANTGTLYVSPGGDDASGTGTVGAPYRTLTAAVSAATEGSTIVIANGDYSAASGEAFPIDVSGLTLQGQSTAGTIVSGTPAALVGLAIAGGETTVSDLTVTGFSTTTEGANVRITSGTVRLEDVIVSDGAHRGVSIEGGSVTLRSVTVTGSRDDNVVVRGAAALDVVDGLISDSINADGIDIGDTATLKLRTTEIVGNDGSGIELNASSGADLGTASDPGGNTIKGNALEGGNAAQLDDERAPGATLIPAVGNDFGVAVSGVQTGPDKLGFVWSIEGAGNQIDFGP